MNDIDLLRKELLAFLDTCSEVKLAMLHKYMTKLEAQSDYQANLSARILREKKIKDWWSNLTEAQTLAVDTAIAELDKGQGINDLKIRKLHPTWFQ